MRKILNWRNISLGLLLLVALSFLLRKIGIGFQNPLSTASGLARQLEKLGVTPELSRIIMAQAYHETGNFTSKIYKENKNFFGMKMPRKRKTTAIGEKNGYANYKYYSDSLEDLKLWLDYNGIDETTPLSGLPLEEAIGWYVYHIKNDGFFEDSYENYFRGVRNGYKKLFGV